MHSLIRRPRRALPQPRRNKPRQPVGTAQTCARLRGFKWTIWFKSGSAKAAMGSHLDMAPLDEEQVFHLIALIEHDGLWRKHLLCQDNSQALYHTCWQRLEHWHLCTAKRSQQWFSTDQDRGSCALRNKGPADESHRYGESSRTWHARANAPT